MESAFPAADSLTRRSISALLRSTGMRGRVQTGSVMTSSGKSHSCERPTWYAVCPRTCTISVALAIRETMRGIVYLGGAGAEAAADHIRDHSGRTRPTEATPV